MVTRPTKYKTSFQMFQIQAPYNISDSNILIALKEVCAIDEVDTYDAAIYFLLKSYNDFKSKFMLVSLDKIAKAAQVDFGHDSQRLRVKNYRITNPVILFALSSVKKQEGFSSMHQTLEYLLRLYSRNVDSLRRVGY